MNSTEKEVNETMTESELRKLLRQGESENLEFKESFDREAVETAGAFANAHGGVILIGVSGKRQPTGVEFGKGTVNDWANQICSATDPRVIPDIEIVEARGKTIAAIRIKEFPAKPVSVRGRCYRRIGSSNRMMTPSEIAQMHLVSTGSSWDVFPVPDVALKDIDLQKVKRYVKRANATGRRSIDPADPPLKVLKKLKLLTDGQPTLAAVVLFRKTDEWTTFPPPAHCGRFKQEVVIVDNQMIAGTAIEMVDKIMDFIRKNTNVRLVVTDKPTHDQVWDYPLNALREAVTNAICHRDYRDRTDIQIKIHDDRLTIWNPGGLLLGMTIQELYNPNHSSVLRNQLIGQVFYDIELIERYGGGIHKILDACQAAGIPPPTFEEKFGGFLVTFYRDIYSEEHLRTLGLNERQAKAVNYTRERGKITNKEYQCTAVVSKPTASRELALLCDMGILERRGIHGQGIHYVLRIGSELAQKPHRRLRIGSKGSQRATTGPNGSAERRAYHAAPKVQKAQLSRAEGAETARRERDSRPTSDRKRQGRVGENVGERVGENVGEDLG